jgi:diacylglycerol kinase family enzyme
VQRVALIVNPLASRVTPSVATAVERALARVGSVETLLTEATGHATELARGSTDRADALVVFSGDGGFNEVLNGVDGALPVGFVPGGGSSVLPRALGLPREPVAAAERIAAALDSGRTRRISLGRVNGRRFGFASGVGLDAEVVRRVDAYGREGGRRRGDATFVLELAKLVARNRYAAPRATLHAAGRSERCALVIAANMHPWSYAGPLPLRAAPRAQAEAGIDVLAPARLGRRQAPRAARYLLVDGAHARREIPGFPYFHDVAEAILTCDEPLPAEVDGDDIGDVTEVRFGVDYRGARLLV